MEEIYYLQKEIQRLNQIISAYEIFRELSHKELKLADQTIKAYQEIQELNRVEQMALYDKLNLQKKQNFLEDEIKKLLDLYPYDDEQIIEKIKKEKPNIQNVFSSFFYVLTHFEFSEDQAKTIYKEIKQIQKEMELLLKRKIDFRVVMLDYFINSLKIFKNPVTIEIQILEHLQNQAIFDELTNLYNRRFIFYFFNKELDRAKRHKHELTVILFDIDNFKKINDSMGHLVGDNVLRLFAKVLKDNIRNEDTLGRIGGEEFLLILPETSIYNSTKLINRIRDILSEISDNKLFFTFSSGISGYPYHGEDAMTLLHLADKSLLKAKVEGKNRDYIYNNF